MTLERDGLPQLDQYVRALSADGTLLLYGDRPMMVYDVATGASIETLSGDEGEHFFAEFEPQGSVAYISGRDGTLRVWDAAVGSLLSELPAVGGGRPSATVDGRVLIGDTTERVARLLDPSRRGESTSVETCRGFAHANSFNVVGDAAAFIIECSDGRNQVVVADVRESEVVATIRDAYGQDMALSPDGTRVVAQTLSGSIQGPLKVYDARSGEIVVRLEGMCEWDDMFIDSRGEAPPPCKPFPETPFPIWAFQVDFSPDGHRVMLADDGVIAIWDADSGALIKALTEEDMGDFATGAIFTPDSKELIVNAGGEVLGVSTSTWTIQERGQLDPTIDGVDSTKFLGFLPDGTLIAVTGFGRTAGGSLLWIDPESGEILRAPVRAHVGSPKSGALSPDGTKIVTGAADGVVRVWDSGSGGLLHEFRVTGQAQGVAFLGNDRVAVTPYNGNIEVFLLDPGALVAAARASLTRSFTPEECDRFDFGDACPTLDELRGSPSQDGG